MREQRRADELDADEVRVEVGNRERGELAADDRDLVGSRAEPAVLARPGGDREPGSRQRAEVAAPGFEIVVAGAEHGDRVVGVPWSEPRRQLRAHPRAEVGCGVHALVVCADLFAQRRLLHLAAGGARQVVAHLESGRELEAREPVLEQVGAQLVEHRSCAVGGDHERAHLLAHHRDPGAATHAASATLGWVTSSASTSWAETFSPPRMITSFRRSTIVRYVPS